MLRTIIIGVGVVIVAAAAYLVLWPVPIEPVRWNAPVASEYVGVQPSDGLSDLQQAPLGPYREPEQIVIGPDGKVYTAVSDGKVLRMNADLSGIEVFADTGGRVLGFAFDAAGNMIAADANGALISIAPDGGIVRLVDQVDGSDLLYPDAVAIAANGRIYFTDASMRFSAKQYGPGLANLLDMFEQSATGRIIEFDPETRTTRIVARGLGFPNGLVMSEDQSSLFVAETARYRIWRIALAAQDLDVNQPSAQATILLDNLPGFPDNLMRGLEGRIWVGFPAPRAPALDEASPFMRKLALRLPASFMPAPVRLGRVMAFTEDGRIVADLQDPSGAIAEITGLTETADRLYLHHIDELPGIPWMEASRLKTLE